MEADQLALSKMTLEIFSKLEQEWLSSTYNTTTNTNNKNNINIDGLNSTIITKKTRILSIDGGGPTIGTVAGASLIHLESQIQSKTGNSTARIADFFDIIAGTGIGALYAAMLTSDDGTGRPLYSAKEAVAFLSSTTLHNNHSSSLFNPTNIITGLLLLGPRSCGSIRRKEKTLDRALKSAFTRKEDGKVLTLRDTCKPLLIPCFDLNSSAPFVFSRAGAAESESLDFELWKVCRATASTPSVFRPFGVISVDRKTTCLAVDGGLVMNNPAAAAVTHVLHNRRDFPGVSGVEDLAVLSLGNGTSGGVGGGRRRRNGYGCRNGNGNGECAMGEVIEIVMDGGSETVDQMMGNAFCWNRTDYVRIQANAIGCTTKTTMEDVLNERGVEALPFGGKRVLLETNGQRIENFVQRLIATGKSTSLPPSPCKSVSPLVDGR